MNPAAILIVDFDRMICGLIDGTLAITTIPPCLHRAAGVHLPLHPLGDILLEDLWVKCWEMLGIKRRK